MNLSAATAPADRAPERAAHGAGADVVDLRAGKSETISVADMRVPAIPLATVDPYFSLWMPADRLTDEDAVHWTGAANLLRGVAVVDGAPHRFLGRGPGPALSQVSLDVGFFET